MYGPATPANVAWSTCACAKHGVPRRRKDRSNEPLGMGIRTETFCRCFVYVSSVPVTADLPVSTSGSNRVRLTVSRRSDVAMLSRSARFDAALRDIEFHLID